MSRSQWRRRAAQVIDEVIAGLPDSMPDELKKKMVSHAYPFGSREGHPYRMWLIEVNKRFPKKKPFPVFPTMAGPDGVLCVWCRPWRANAPDVPCLACSDARRRLGSFTGDRAEWRRLLQLAVDDFTTRFLLADWLEEHGLERESHWVRHTWDHHTAALLLALGG